MKKSNFSNFLFLLKYLGITFTLFLFLFIYSWQSSQKTLLERKIKTLTQKKETLIKDKHQLKTEIADIISGKKTGLYKKTYRFLPPSITQKVVKIQLEQENIEN